MVGHRFKLLICEQLAARSDRRAFHILYHPLPSAPGSSSFGAVCSGHKLATPGISHLRSLRHLLIQLGIAILFKNAFKCSSLNLVLR
jgi:hypothetical protein